MPERRAATPKDLLAWLATLLAFPIAGLAAEAVTGGVDSFATALFAGLVSGLVLGVAQWLALRRLGADPRWIAATAVGLGAGLGVAYASVGYGDSVTDLALVGAISGLGIGTAQWWLLRGIVGGSVLWIPATAIAWALGWSVTIAIGVDPDDRWANPGLSGAATATLLLAVVLFGLARRDDRVRAVE